MAWPTIFGNLAAGPQQLALFDSMFTQVALMVAIPCTASGTNAITLSPIGNAPSLNNYQNYQMFRFKPAANSSGPVTLQYQSLGFLNAYQHDGATQVGSGNLLTTTEYLAVFDQTRNAGAGGFYLEDASQALPGGAVAIPPSQPGGRLTLQTGVPIMTGGSVTSATVFYTPYLHTFAPFNVSGSMQMQNFGGELSQTLADATKSPAAAVTGMYFMFLWNDGGTYRCTRGPVWTNNNTPGAANALTTVNGVTVNSVGITNGPAANAGTLVGAIFVNSSILVPFQTNIQAAATPTAVVGLDNVYNRARVDVCVADTRNSWTYSTDAWRVLNGDWSGVFFVNWGGSARDFAFAEYRGMWTATFQTACPTNIPVPGSVSVGAPGPTPGSGSVITAQIGPAVFVGAPTASNAIPGSASVILSPNIGLNQVVPVERAGTGASQPIVQVQRNADANHFQPGFMYHGVY